MGGGGRSETKEKKRAFACEGCNFRTDLTLESKEKGICSVWPSVTLYLGNPVPLEVGTLFYPEKVKFVTGLDQQEKEVLAWKHSQRFWRGNTVSGENEMVMILGSFIGNVSSWGGLCAAQNPTGKPRNS